MKSLEQILEEGWLGVEAYGASLKNPVTGDPEPISGDWVRKLLPRIRENNPKHVQWIGRYVIWKDAPDPRERNPDGSIHIGRPGKRVRISKKYERKFKE